MASKDRITAFHSALHAANAREYKADMLAGYGVESTKDLTNDQLDELIERLNDMQRKRKGEVPKAVRRQRSVILTILNKMGIYADNGDWSRVNAFLMQPRIAGKLLYEMNSDELLALARKLRVIQRKQDENRQQEDYQARNN